VPRQDLLEQCPRPVALQLRSRDPAEVIPPVSEQSAAAEDCRSDGIPPGEQVFDRYWLATPEAFEELEIGRGEEPDIVRVLPIDALEALRDHEPDAGGLLGHRAVLARGAFAVALARDDDGEAGLPDCAHTDGQPLAALETGVGVVAEALVEERQRRQRRDLIGRNIVAKRADGFEAEIGPGNLGVDPAGLGAKQQNASRQGQRRHISLLFIAPTGARSAGDAP